MQNLYIYLQTLFLRAPLGPITWSKIFLPTWASTALSGSSNKYICKNYVSKIFIYFWFKFKDTIFFNKFKAKTTINFCLNKCIWSLIHFKIKLSFFQSAKNNKFFFFKHWYAAQNFDLALNFFIFILFFFSS